MATLKDIKNELKYKEKKISDLIRFIENRTDQNPNYSLLLGAGCSITSGVKSATSLIDLWKKDVFIEENDIEYSIESADQYFNDCVWYDSRNPYSSLFEKKYDLPRQRRVFVEKEVGDKAPSIGYTYLTKLVENDYFRTIFTTNFDDLINEAFYQYSSIRPILCAHDSAISSITITSKRPKIIKLHGDYLFDDIKSTLRETESLQDNIKNKFIEFAKDYGLIVMGYAGNDRSIVDILTHLLKNEDYFKHGIYWCLRKDSEINEDLRKLLWKEKVFFVEIEGFDEVMAEMHSKLNKNTLPLDNSLLNERKDNLIKSLLSNQHLKNTKNKYIKNDMQRLKKTLESDVISNFFNYLGKKDSNKKRTSKIFKEKKSSIKKDSIIHKHLLEIQEAIYTKKYKEALDIIEDKFNDIESTDTHYIEVMELKAKSYKEIDMIKDAVSTYQNLIKHDKYDLQYYIYLSHLLGDYSEKLSILEEALQIDPYFESLHFYKCKFMLEYYEESLDKNNIGLSYKEIEKFIDDGIEINPGISNPIYNLKFTIIEKLNSPENTIKEQKKLLEKLEKQDRFHPIVLENHIDIAMKESKSDEIIKFFQDRKEECQHKQYNKVFEILELDLYARLVQPINAKQKIEYIENKYEYEYDIDYLEKKAEIELELFNDVEASIGTLNNIGVKSKSHHKKLIGRYLYLDKIEEAESIYNKYIKDDKKVYINILEAKKDYNGALLATEEYIKEKPNDNGLYVLKSFLMLKLGHYDEALKFTQDALKHSSYSDLHLLVNYFVALKKKNKLKNDKVMDKIINNVNSSKIVKAAGYALINDKDNTFKLLNEVCKKDNSFRYCIKDWVVFDEINDNERFIKLVS